MSTLTLEGRDLAGELYAFLRALDRTPSAEAIPSLRAQAEALKARCLRLLESEDAREEAMSALVRALGGIGRALEELCARLAQGSDSACAAFASFRSGVAPRYEAFVSRLRSMRVEAPSLRPKNNARSVFHMSSALLAVLLIVFAPWSLVQAAAGVFFVFSWSLEIGRRYSPALMRFSMMLFGKFAHPHEHVRTNSATWYATALLPISIFCAPMAGALGVVALGFGDPAAAYVGRRWGKHRIHQARSLEGSLAFVAVAFLLSVTLLGLWKPELALSGRLLLAGAGALVGALAELFSGQLDDNLTIPLLVAMVCTGLLSFL